MLLAVFRVLLRLCPKHLRRDYGREMEALFVKGVERERRRRGPWHRRWSCARGLVDVVAFAAGARWEQFRSRPLRLGQSLTRTTRRTPVIAHDLRGALRAMRAQPVMSSAIVVMLALGVGATTAIFSVVHGVLLKPLPFPEPDRIVQVFGSNVSRGWARITLTEANFWDLHDQNTTLEAFGALSFDSFTMTGAGANAAPERVSGGKVTTGLFRSLGVRPVAGRLFETGEDLPGRGESLALLSHRLWTRGFAADPGVVGRSITLDGRPYTVIGVLPPGTPWLDVAEVFVPFLRRANPNRGSFEYTGIARLKPGVTIDGALADLTAISRRLEASYPGTNTGVSVVLDRSRSWAASDQLRRTLWILLGAVVLLLLIAGLNVTNLLLVRASTRARENAVRTALGASRADLIRERLTESLLYSGLDAAAGWLVAAWMLKTLQRLEPGGIPRLAEVTLNGTVLAFAIAAAVVVGLLTGLVPALRAPMGNVVGVLRQGARGAAGDRGQSRLRNTFVAAQVAVALVLLAGAGLLVRSLIGVLSVDRGFKSENRLLMTVSVPSSYGPARIGQTNQALIDRITGLTSVVAAAAINVRPLSRGSVGLGLAAADKPETPGGAVPWATWRIVTPGYFASMGLPLLAGREFTPQDVIGKPWRTVISKRAADLLWPGENPIGKTAILWKGLGNRQGEVIGVVGDMRERGLENEPTLAVYFPAGGAMDATTLQLVVHTRVPPNDAIASLRAAIGAVDPGLPVSNIRTLDEVVTASVATRRMTMWLLLTFAGLALMLALAGVYGVLAYSISRRTSEIGVRLALGAEPRVVLRSVVAHGMKPVLAGAAVGLAVAFAASRLMATLLFEVRPNDPATFAAVILSLLGVATLACYLPARRVLRVDPSIALRAD
jgi:putative ABC transport system permease protein